MRLTDIVFICFDFETTGISSQFDRIVDVGAVRFMLNQQGRETFSELVNPGCQITATASSIHGIYNQDVANSPVIGEVLPKFLSFIQPADLLIAHNAGFDTSFLSNACLFAGLKHPAVSAICSLPICRRAWPDLKNYRLETIGQELGLIDVEEHRGLSDSLLLESVFRLAMQQLEIRTTEELFAISKPQPVEERGVNRSAAPQGFELFEEAIEESIDMVIQYGDERSSLRTITPTCLVANRNRVYVVAVCHRDGIEKQFRLDRMYEFHLAIDPSG